MEVFLGYLIRGEVDRYQTKLIRDLASISGERKVSHISPLPNHVTFKSPFVVRNLKRLEYILEEFVTKQKLSSARLDGFGCFGSSVYFLNFEFARGAFRAQKDLLGVLREEMSVRSHKFDVDWKPHATISYVQNKRNFNKIRDYLNKLKKPEFDLVFDNITLFVKPRRYWKVHKIFEIGS